MEERKLPVNILGVAGSMRSDSHSTRVLKIAPELAKKHGAEVRLLDLSKKVLPFRDPGAPASPQVKEAANDVVWADAFILASPDYHGSMSAATKNFLDNFYPEFADKVFGYIVASHEKGLTVMDQMRTAVRQCYGCSLPYGFAINGDQEFADGRITNEELSRRFWR